MAFQVVIYDVPQGLETAEVEAALEALPLWRHAKALAYRRERDRYLCAKSWLMLREALEAAGGPALAGLAEAEPGRGPAGKPALPGRADIHFSISHCDRCVAVVVADSPVGIDAEVIQYDDDVANAAFSEQERKEMDETKFTRLWTMKESFLKMTGEGMRNDMRNVLDDARPEMFRSQERNGCIVTVCMDNNQWNV